VNRENQGLLRPQGGKRSSRGPLGRARAKRFCLVEAVSGSHPTSSGQRGRAGVQLITGVGRLTGSTSPSRLQSPSRRSPKLAGSRTSIPWVSPPRWGSRQRSQQ